MLNVHWCSIAKDLRQMWCGIDGVVKGKTMDGKSERKWKKEERNWFGTKKGVLSTYFKRRQGDQEKAPPSFWTWIVS